MVNFLCSSIGKKLIMSLSDLFLVVFLLLHLALNLTALLSESAYNAVCAFMNENILIQIMVPVLAGGFIVHILFSMFVEFKNWTGRPRDMRYAVANKSKATSWASKNMFVLGVIVILFLFLHLFHFWSKMQLASWLGAEEANPYQLVVKTFSCPCVCVLYIVWFAAIYYHVSHGFWSAFQTLGLSNSKWLPRLQFLAKLYAIVVFWGFTLVPVCFYLRNCCGCCGASSCGL